MLHIKFIYLTQSHFISSLPSTTRGMLGNQTFVAKVVKQISMATVIGGSCWRKMLVAAFVIIRGVP
jgi:hypothetical protein